VRTPSSLRRAIHRHVHRRRRARPRRAPV
jgi:hypothetical protein